MADPKPSKRPIIAAALLGALLVIATTVICLWIKEAPGESPTSDSDNPSQMDTTAPQDTQSDDITEADDGDPTLSYKTRFFTAQLPPSWEGRWDVSESISTRESMLDIAGYHYDFRLDGVSQFSISCQLANINADFVIGGADGYAVHLFMDDNMPAADEFYIKQHLRRAPSGE